MKKETGITIVALVVTIVVMLILVGVSVTVSINGGLFNTTKESTYKTEVSQVKEALEEEIVQRKARRESVDNITIADLDIPDKIKDKYKDKLIVSEICEIEYDPSVITDKTEQKWLENIGVICLSDYYTYDGNKVTGLSKKGAEAIDRGMTTLIIPKQNKDGKVTKYVGSWAFNAAKGRLYVEQNIKVKEIVLPDTIESIGDAGFQWLSGLEKMELPKSITWVGYQAFFGSFKKSTGELHVPFTQEEIANMNWNSSWKQYVQGKIIYADETT